MIRPETISRNHDLSYQRVDLARVKNPGIQMFWKVVETYRLIPLFHWYIDQDGTQYRACESQCGFYGIMSATKSGWTCEVCLTKEKMLEDSKQAKIDYAKRFETRVCAACGEARKQLPRANIRKGRKRNVVVYTHAQGVEDAINAVFGRHNLKLGYNSRLEHPNATYGRRQADVTDINPMRAFEKVINNEAE